MKLNNKVTNANSTEEFALTDTELETVLGGQGWNCTPPYDGGSPNYGSNYGSPNYGGGSSSCGGNSPSYGNSSYAPNYGSSYGPNASSSDSGNVVYSVVTTTTTYYAGAPVSNSSCGGSY